MCECVSCVRVCVRARCSVAPDGQSACMWPDVSTAALRNEAPSAAFFFTAMSVCCDANEPLPPQTPPLIGLFDLPLIPLIRSPTFKVERFASTSKCAPARVCVSERVCVCLCVLVWKTGKKKWEKFNWVKSRRPAIAFFSHWTWLMLGCCGCRACKDNAFDWYALLHYQQI